MTASAAHSVVIEGAPLEHVQGDEGTPEARKRLGKSLGVGRVPHGGSKHRGALPPARRGVAGHERREAYVREGGRPQQTLGLLGVLALLSKLVVVELAQ